MENSQWMLILQGIIGLVGIIIAWNFVQHDKLLKKIDQQQTKIQIDYATFTSKMGEIIISKINEALEPIRNKIESLMTDKKKYELQIEQLVEDNKDIFTALDSQDRRILTIEFNNSNMIKVHNENHQ